MKSSLCSTYVCLPIESPKHHLNASYGVETVQPQGGRGCSEANPFCWPPSTPSSSGSAKLRISGVGCAA